MGEGPPGRPSASPPRPAPIHTRGVATKSFYTHEILVRVSNAMRKSTTRQAMKKIVNGRRLEQLKGLLTILADEIDQRPGARDMAQLARQYCEILKEIEEIEGMTDDGDEISEILTQREHNGESGAVRKNRTKL